MFDIPFQYSDDEKDYQLDLGRDRNWKSSKRRVLIILQSVPTVSLKDKVLVTDYVKTTLNNCVRMARKMARGVKEIPEYSFAIANFNNYKHLSLKGSAKAEAEAIFTRRVNKIIKKLDPTHVFVSGDNAAAHLLPDVSNIAYKRGWIMEKDGRKFCTTFDLDRCFQKNFMYADLLGFWCRHLSYLLIGKHPYSLKDLPMKPRYVGTIDDFKKMMRRIEALGPKDHLALDTETLNLSSRSNSVYTSQFCLSVDPTVGYVLPINHPKTPFDAKEIAYIRKRLKAYLDQTENLPMLITFNGNFDLKVVRAELKLPIIYNEVWEIRAGEHDLDENIGTLSKVGPAMGGLAAVFASYENEHYYTAAFSKAERMTTGLVEPNDKEFLKYAAADVCSIMAIREMQIKRASHEELNGKSYKPWFMAHMHNIMSATTHTISHLEADGSFVDQKYLRSLLASDSPLRAEIKKQEMRLRKSPHAIEANKQLLAESGLSAGSLWGGEALSTWVLKLSKGMHKQKLFFDVMGLEPVSETKKGEPAIDKEFIEAYAYKVPEVQILGDWSKRSTLLGTYVKGWLKRLMKDIDGRKDSYLRSSYSFFQVVTGRLGSWDPNLQNIPSRGILSKIIKAMFTTTKGKLLIRFDYSAHEVRMWAIAAADKVLANSFASGLNLRQQLIAAVEKEVVDKIFAELKTKGDVHIQNVFRFWKKWVSKDDPLRDAVKAVVFGVLYGLSPASLGRSIGPYALAAKELKNLARKFKDADEAERKAIKKKRRELREFLDCATQKQREKADTAYAQSIIDMMFEEFKKGGQWTNRMKEMAEKEYYAYSPFGRKRRLWAALTGVRSVVSSSIRQGSNAPIQGYASESGVRSSRDVAKAYYKALPELAEKLGYSTEPDDLMKLWIEFNRIVHDALYHGVPYEMVIPFIHVLQWHSTFGLAAALGKEFNIDFLVPPEIEIEIGAQDTKSYKWNWTMPDLARILDRAVVDAGELGLLDRPASEVMEQIYRPYKVKKVRKLLQERWPLLNVRDLDHNIKNMELDYLETLKADKAEYKRYRKLRDV